MNRVAVIQGSAVPVYFFDALDSTFAPDGRGIELADLDAARVYARHAVARLMIEAVQDEAPPSCTVTVRDETGERVYAASLDFSLR